MRVMRVALYALTGLMLLSPTAPLAVAQDADFATRGPRFLLASNATPVRIDVARTPILRQRLSLDLAGVSVHEAIAAIARQSGMQLMYSERLLPEGRAVTLRAQ